MATWPPRLPSAARYRLRRAAVPACLLAAPAKPDAEGLAVVDIDIADGRIAAIGADAGDAPAIDLGGNQLWPCPVDMHTHLDKGHIWPRAENPDGSFDGALTTVAADRAARWNAEDVRRRMEFGLRSAYAHGTAAIRTHLDSIAPQHRITWPVFARLRDEWQGRIALQGVSIQKLDLLQGGFGDELADLIAAHGGVLGGVALPGPELPALIDRLFQLAASRGLDIDLHADESGDPQAQALRLVAEAKLRHRFAGRVVVGHCCSLAVQVEAEIDRTLDRVAAAGLCIVSLPMCNLFLQDRGRGRTPRWRGVTLLHEMRARGISVALAGDNCRDPFYGYGDHDMNEVFTQAVRIAHLDRPIGQWPAAVARIPADIIGLPSHGRLATGGAADFVLYNARRFSELLSRPQADRVVLRGGRAIDTTLPSYRELDDLMTAG